MDRITKITFPLIPSASIAFPEGGRPLNVIRDDATTGALFVLADEDAETEARVIQSILTDADIPDGSLIGTQYLGSVTAQIDADFHIFLGPSD